MSDVDAALEQDLFHVTVAQGEAIIEPDAMADDLAGEAVVLVACGGQVDGVISAASPEVSLVCEGAPRRGLCHRRRRVGNNLTYMDPPALSRGFREETTRFGGTDAVIYPYMDSSRPAS